MLSELTSCVLGRIGMPMVTTVVFLLNLSSRLFLTVVLRTSDLREGLFGRGPAHSPPVSLDAIAVPRLGPGRHYCHVIITYLCLRHTV